MQTTHWELKLFERTVVPTIAERTASFLKYIMNFSILKTLF
jgi:hypothetical protein